MEGHFLKCGSLRPELLRTYLQQSQRKYCTIHQKIYASKTVKTCGDNCEFLILVAAPANHTPQRPPPPHNATPGTVYHSAEHTPQASPRLEPVVVPPTPPPPPAVLSVEMILEALHTDIQSVKFIPKNALSDVAMTLTKVFVDFVANHTDLEAYARFVLFPKFVLAHTGVKKKKLGHEIVLKTRAWAEMSILEVIQHILGHEDQHQHFNRDITLDEQIVIQCKRKVRLGRLSDGIKALE